MSEAAVTDEYADRRRHTRRSIYRTAELVVRDRGDGMDCTVLDESEGGIQLELMNTLNPPEEAMIKFSDMASQLVRRCWAKGSRGGYQYIHTTPAQRSWLPELFLPAAEARPAWASFTAFNEFVHISGSALGLSGEPGELLYPAEQIHALLSCEPNGRRLSEVEPVEYQNFFGPRWMS